MSVPIPEGHLTPASCRQAPARTVNPLAAGTAPPPKHLPLSVSWLHRLQGRGRERSTEGRGAQKPPGPPLLRREEDLREARGAVGAGMVSGPYHPVPGALPQPHVLEVLGLTPGHEL